VSLVIGAAFRYGLLAMGTKAYTGTPPITLGEDELNRARRIERACEELGVPLPAAAIQFPFGHPAVRSVLFGALDGDQVRQTLEHLKRPVPSELWDRLRAEGLLAANAPVPSGV
jgi:D-threo-aldose 1-dehydrogenase